MATILDQLTLELGWDVRQFLQASKQVDDALAKRRDEFERQSKVWEAGLSRLGVLLTKVGGAFLSIEAVLRGIEASRTISATGTSFANLSEQIGMSVEQLSMWEQAMGRVGGNASEAGSALKRVQEDLTNSRLQGGAPSFLGQMQLLGLPDWNSYYNASTRNYDVNKLMLDVDAAMERQHRSAAERANILKGFHFEGTSAQALFNGRLREQLEATRSTAMSQKNEEAFRRLNTLWVALANAADKAKQDLVTYFQEPLAKILESITNIINAIRVDPFSLAKDTWRQFKEESFWDFWGGIHTYDTQGRGTSNSWHDFFFGKSPPPQSSVAPTSPTPNMPLFRGGGGGALAAPSGLPPGGAAMPLPHYDAPGTTSPAPAKPLSFNDRWNDRVEGAVGGSGPSGAVQQQLRVHERLRRYQHIIDMSKHSSLTAPNAGNTTTTNNQSVTIGAMAFHSRADDTALGKAPSGVAKDLSVGQYSVHFNEAYE